LALKARFVAEDHFVSSSNLVAALEVGTVADDYIQHVCTQASRKVVVRIVVEYAAQACALEMEYAAQAYALGMEYAAQVYAHGMKAAARFDARG